MIPIIVALAFHWPAQVLPAHPPIAPPPPNEVDGLNRDLLRFVEDESPIRNEVENRDESLAYDYLVRYAANVSAAAFKNSARRDVTFAQLLGPEASKFRGEVIHVEGRLKRLRDIGPTPALEADGIQHVYEGWILSELYRGYSYCVLFTDLPSGITPAEQLDLPASFDGYFFKIYRFRAGDGPRRAPLLIGRAIMPKLDAIAEPGVLGSMSRTAIVLSGAIVGAFVLAGGLIIAFRRSDRLVRHRIQKARESANPPPELL